MLLTVCCAMYCNTEIKCVCGGGNRRPSLTGKVFKQIKMMHFKLRNTLKKYVPLEKGATRAEFFARVDMRV